MEIRHRLMSFCNFLKIILLEHPPHQSYYWKVNPQILLSMIFVSKSYER